MGFSAGADIEAVPASWSTSLSTRDSSLSRMATRRSSTEDVFFTSTNKVPTSMQGLDVEQSSNETTQAFVANSLLTGGVKTKQTRCDGCGCAEDPLPVSKQRKTLKSQIKSNQAKRRSFASGCCQADVIGPISALLIPTAVRQSAQCEAKTKPSSYKRSLLSGVCQADMMTAS
jgi:hypothetical protein